MSARALAIATCAAAAAAAGLPACAGEAPRPESDRGLIVLGVDGMDPNLVERFVREGRMPNVARLIENNGMIRLGTSMPPQSPVAWSSFITGSQPDVHGIYDFVHRDPRAMAPYLSTARTEGGSAFAIGSLAFQTSAPRVELLREGVPFWNALEDAGVPVTIVKVPANFPPSSTHQAEVLAGMGTPDLMGTYGTFQVLTTDGEVAAAGNPSGGRVHLLEPRGDQRYAADLAGPPDPLSADGDILTLPVEVIVDRRRPVALVRLGDRPVILQPGEWSAWVPIGFDPGLLAGEARGMVRLSLKSVEPHVTVYVSPINIDPIDPAMPVSSPASYAPELAGDTGRFYTQGMPEDTKALAAGALSDEEFLIQADLVYEERLRLLERELDRFDGGVLFFYFSSIDQVSHVFWRKLDTPDDVLADLYARVDAAIGHVIDRAADRPDATDVIVMSDHGFGPYTRKVHLNTWLAERGYLALRPAGDVGDGALGHIDWSRTQAYALGLNQVFLNIRGRERDGVVAPQDREVLLNRLARELSSMRDPDTGARVVTRVYPTDPSRFADRAPDLIVGYNRGYRSSDQSALGQVGAAVFEANTDKWSGDHCVDASLVPGVLMSTAPLVRDSATLLDLAPTILAYFGVAPAGELPGAPLLAGGDP